MTDRFDGRVALLTGASRGIGFATAERLVSEGARVSVTGRTPASLEEAVAALGGPERAIGIAGKAHGESHQAEAVEKTLATFGRIDILVNNAGTNPVYGPVLEMGAAAARKVFEVNTIAPLGWLKQVHDAWLCEHGGVVVNVASVAGLHVSSGIGLYGASKAALIQLTRQLAAELGPTVRVNAVAPAVVKTSFARALYEGKEREVVDSYPLERLGTPADVAEAVAYVASDDASWVTGQTLVLDGGLTSAQGLL